jgi:hypothetical protein
MRPHFAANPSRHQENVSQPAIVHLQIFTDFSERRIGRYKCSGRWSCVALPQYFPASRASDSSAQIFRKLDRMFLVYVKICVIFSSGAIKSNYKMKSREPDFTCVAIILRADSLNIHCFLPFFLRLSVYCTANI